MKLYVPNTYLIYHATIWITNIENSHDRTFIGRSNEWFDFPLLFMFFNKVLVLMEFQNDVTLP